MGSEMCIRDRDYQAAMPFLERAISESFRATFALADLVEITSHEKEYAEALRLRRDFLKRRPPGRAYWQQVTRKEARAHGTRTQYAYWTAYTGLAELTVAGQTARALMDKLNSHSYQDWVAALGESESVKLTNSKWRFIFHRGLWALRNDGHWKLARRYLFRRLLLASFSDQALTPVVPPLTVL